MDWSRDFSKSPTAKIAAERHNRAHTYHYTKNISIKIRKNSTISRSAGGVNAPRLLATRTFETTEIPAGMQKRDLWGFRYTSEQKFLKMTKNTRGSMTFSNLCLTYIKSFQGLPFAI